MCVRTKEWLSKHKRGKQDGKKRIDKLASSFSSPKPSSGPLCIPVRAGPGTGTTSPNSAVGSHSPGIFALLYYPWELYPYTHTHTPHLCQEEMSLAACMYGRPYKGMSVRTLNMNANLQIGGNTFFL